MSELNVSIEKEVLGQLMENADCDHTHAHNPIV